jgi:hypothetical protein
MYSTPQGIIMNANTQLNREQFIKYHAAFKTLAAAKLLTPADMVLHNLMRDLPATRGFSPTTNQQKIAAGQHRLLGLKQAVAALKFQAKYRKQQLIDRYSGTLTDQHLTDLAHLEFNHE